MKKTSESGVWRSSTKPGARKEVPKLPLNSSPVTGFQDSPNLGFVVVPKSLYFSCLTAEETLSDWIAGRVFSSPMIGTKNSP